MNFPASASFAAHTPETVLEHVVAPVGDLVMRVSRAARSLQHGRLQSYLLYLLIVWRRWRCWSCSERAMTLEF